MALAHTTAAIGVFYENPDGGAHIRAAAALAGPEPDHPILRLVLAVLALSDAGERPSAAAGLADLFADDDPWVRAAAHLVRGFDAINRGRMQDVAYHECQAALAGFRELGDRWGLSFALGALGELAGLRGRHAEAAACYSEALDLVAELGTYEDVAHFQVSRARQLWLAGEAERALAVLAQAQRTAERVGLPETLAAAEFARGEIARLTGDLPAARRWLDAARDHVAHRGVSPQFRAIVSGGHGYLAAAGGDVPAAARHHRAAVDAALSSSDAPVAAMILVGVADLAVLTGDAASAAELLGAGVAVRGGADLSLPDVTRVEQAARARLGPDGFAAAYERGLAATIESAAALAGAVLDAAARDAAPLDAAALEGAARDGAARASAPRDPAAHAGGAAEGTRPVPGAVTPDTGPAAAARPVRRGA